MKPHAIVNHAIRERIRIFQHGFLTCFAGHGISSNMQKMYSCMRKNFNNMDCRLLCHCYDGYTSSGLQIIVVVHVVNVWCSFGFHELECPNASQNLPNDNTENWSSTKKSWKLVTKSWMQTLTSIAIWNMSFPEWISTQLFRCAAPSAQLPDFTMFNRIWVGPPGTNSATCASHFSRNGMYTKSENKHFTFVDRDQIKKVENHTEKWQHWRQHIKREKTHWQHNKMKTPSKRTPLKHKTGKPEKHKTPWEHRTPWKLKNLKSPLHNDNL